ncbi:vegetative cell wall protein gp1-like [Oryza glaberrima]|uniref:vegetative cell wall protein gp1-like n=1 Tax=Oryza glaberrima TaxID=4538 RepID=UPI00224C4D2D|nr:vegetative cell wall protein gp1-like [Oryza glaberrima]
MKSVPIHLLYTLPTFPPKIVPGSSSTSPTMSPTSPVIAAPNPPRPALVFPPRAYKVHPRAPFSRFPSSPALPSPSPALPTPLPRAAALRRAPVASSRRSRHLRAAPSPPSASPSHASPRHPFPFPPPPPEPPLHRAPEAADPFVASSRTSSLLAPPPRRATHAVGITTPRRTPSTATLPQSTTGLPPPLPTRAAIAFVSAGRRLPSLEPPQHCSAATAGFVATSPSSATVFLSLATTETTFPPHTRATTSIHRLRPAIITAIAAVAACRHLCRLRRRVLHLVCLLALAIHRRESLRVVDPRSAAASLHGRSLRRRASRV